MPGTTDTKKAKVPLGSFIMNYGSSRMYPELAPLARMFSADKDDMSKSQNVILTNGEIYFPPDAVEAIGVEKLEYMNNKSKDGAHDAIDKEMAMNLLKSIKPMYGGGNVMPMGTGGMLDNYAGGGSIMNQYGHGGMIKQDMMNYKHGGKVHKNLKPVPQDNPGLGKLPEAVRNKMGYMQEGGEVQESLMGMMHGGMANKKKKGYQEGGSVFGMNMTPEGAMQAIYEMPTDDGNRYYLGEALRPQQSLSMQVAKSRAKENAMKMAQDSISFEMAQQILNPQAQSESKKKGLMGLLGFQEGGMIGPTLPPEMMGQAMNQQLSDSIDMRMQNPQAGGSIGVARDQAMALQDSINMNTVDSARKSLQLLRLQSLLSEGGDTLNFEGSMMPPNQEMEKSMARDLVEFLKMQTMQRGVGSVRQGMGDEPMRALR